MQDGLCSLCISIEMHHSHCRHLLTNLFSDECLIAFSLFLRVQQPCSKHVLNLLQSFNEGPKLASLGVDVAADEGAFFLGTVADFLALTLVSLVI